MALSAPDRFGGDVSIPEEAFLFELHLLCGGYAYYSVYTKWVPGGEHGTEVRVPGPARTEVICGALATIDQPVLLVRDESDYEHWRFRRGWAAVPREAATEIMPQWLQARECVKCPNGDYTDVELLVPRSSEGRVSRPLRRQVKEREGGRCFVCGATEGEDSRISVRHVVPREEGGETTAHNLVAVCNNCEDAVKTLGVDALLALAESPFANAFRDASSLTRNLIRARQISGDLMHTRCEA